MEKWNLHNNFLEKVKDLWSVCYCLLGSKAWCSPLYLHFPWKIQINRSRKFTLKDSIWFEIYKWESSNMLHSDEYLTCGYQRNSLTTDEIHMKSLLIFSRWEYVHICARMVCAGVLICNHLLVAWVQCTFVFLPTNA